MEGSVKSLTQVELKTLVGISLVYMLMYFCMHEWVEYISLCALPLYIYNFIALDFIVLYIATCMHCMYTSSSNGLYSLVGKL